ncbi:MAG: clostripain-related cysteine peptidase [Candidatus Babeliales bacterium]
MIKNYKINPLALLLFFILHINVTFCPHKQLHDIIKSSTVITDLQTAQENNALADATKARAIKEWTFITYMAADNDLAPFARKNLKQQADVGSTQYINIVTQLDTRIAGNKKITKRYYIEKDKYIATNEKDPHTQKMDSGLPATLIDCCKWAIQNYPARHYALVLWNHGSGAIDFGPRKSINPSPLFMFNPESNLLELDRSIPFIDYIHAMYYPDHRGICFDDSTGHYLSNQDLEYALRTICSTLLGGRKFDLICFDACLMAMLEIANIVKDFADFMPASEEVELGTGYNYYTILKPFETRSLDKKSFAQHIVQCYGAAYGNITKDYTQSALDLSCATALEQSVDRIAQYLIEALKIQKNNTVREAIKISRHKLYCTYFDEPNYLDLHHLLRNFAANSKKFEFTNQQSGKALVNDLHEEIKKALALLEKMVIANVSGKNLAQARGISIYFPERKIYPSYQKTKFAQSNNWFTLIKYFLAA